MDGSSFFTVRLCCNDRYGGDVSACTCSFFNINPGTAIKSEINIKLPLTFIIYALVAFVVAQFVLLLNVDAVVVGQFRSPELWMGAHFLLLGYAVMIVMGAMYQLVPVAFLT